MASGHHQHARRAAVRGASSPNRVPRGCQGGSHSTRNEWACGGRDPNRERRGSGRRVRDDILLSEAHKCEVTQNLKLRPELFILYDVHLTPHPQNASQVTCGILRIFKGRSISFGDTEHLDLELQLFELGIDGENIALNLRALFRSLRHVPLYIGKGRGERGQRMWTT